MGDNSHPDSGNRPGHLHGELAGFTGIAILFCVLLALGLLSGCARRSKTVMIDPAEVWDVVREEAGRYDLNPDFVFAVAFAESTFNAHADSGYGRGIMQLSKVAWKRR